MLTNIHLTHPKLSIIHLFLANWQFWMDKCLCKIYLWRLLKVWLYFLQSFLHSDKKTSSCISDSCRNAMYPSISTYIALNKAVRKHMCAYVVCVCARVRNKVNKWRNHRPSLGLLRTREKEREREGGDRDRERATYLYQIG